MKVTYKFKFLINDAQVVITSSSHSDLELMKNRVIFVADDYKEEEIFKDLLLNFSSFISISFSNGTEATIYSNE